MIGLGCSNDLVVGLTMKELKEYSIVRIFSIIINFCWFLFFEFFMPVDVIVNAL